MGTLDQGYLMIFDTDKVLLAEGLSAMSRTAGLASTTDEGTTTEVGRDVGEAAI